MPEHPQEPVDLLRSVTEDLAELGLAAEIVPVGHSDEGVDAWLRLVTPAGSRIYAVQAKKVNSARAAGLSVHRADSAKPLMIVDHASESMASIWRAQDVHFVDASGNMYLHWPDLIIDIRGRRRRPAVKSFITPGRPRVALKSAGLKVVFMFLCDPATLRLPVRAAGEASGVAHGTVQNVYRELESTGYLDAERRTLHRTRDLFNQWVEGYILNLWPRLVLGRFTAPDPAWWRSSDDELQRLGGQWGGETAAHHHNKNLLPSSAVAYVTEVPREILAKNRMRKAEGEGNVEFRRRFWNFRHHTGTLTVPTPLTYADLIASADPRQREAATDLRESDEVLRRIDRE